MSTFDKHHQRLKDLIDKTHPPLLLSVLKGELLAAWMAADVSAVCAQVPAGWKLVPIEPTGDMIDAGGDTPKMKIIDGYLSTAQLRGGFSEDRLAGPKSDCAIAQVYKAMLATAPEHASATNAHAEQLRTSAVLALGKLASIRQFLPQTPEGDDLDAGAITILRVLEEVIRRSDRGTSG